jgi:hypothetical protein
LQWESNQSPFWGNLQCVSHEKTLDYGFWLPFTLFFTGLQFLFFFFNPKDLSPLWCSWYLTSIFPDGKTAWSQRWFYFPVVAAASAFSLKPSVRLEWGAAGCFHLYLVCLMPFVCMYVWCCICVCVCVYTNHSFRTWKLKENMLKEYSEFYKSLCFAPCAISSQGWTTFVYSLTNVPSVTFHAVIPY